MLGGSFEHPGHGTCRDLQIRVGEGGSWYSGLRGQAQWILSARPQQFGEAGERGSTVQLKPGNPFRHVPIYQLVIPIEQLP